MCVWKQLFKLGFGIQRKLSGPGPNHSILMYCAMKPPVSPPDYSARIWALRLDKVAGRLHPPLGDTTCGILNLRGGGGRSSPTPMTQALLTSRWDIYDFLLIASFVSSGGTCTGMLAVSVADPEMALEPVNGLRWLVMKTLFKFLFNFLGSGQTTSWTGHQRFPHPKSESEL